MIDVRKLAAPKTYHCRPIKVHQFPWCSQNMSNCMSQVGDPYAPTCATPFAINDISTKSFELRLHSDPSKIKDNKQLGLPLDEGRLDQNLHTNRAFAETCSSSTGVSCVLQERWSGYRSSGWRARARRKMAASRVCPSASPTSRAPTSCWRPACFSVLSSCFSSTPTSSSSETASGRSTAAAVVDLLVWWVGTAEKPMFIARLSGDFWHFSRRPRDLSVYEQIQVSRSSMAAGNMFIWRKMPIA